MKGVEEGVVVAGGNRYGNSLKQLTQPSGVIVDKLRRIYVADSGNHRVIRWSEGGSAGRVIVGSNGRGQQANQFYEPRGLTFDHQGNLYVADRWNHRIQKFEIDPS